MRAGIAFGSNLGDRLANLNAARLALLGTHGVSAPVLASSIYETEPLGPGAGDAPFLNAVIEMEYLEHPLALLDRLQSIEASMGRPSKRPRNAPRPIDLDILYFGNLVLSNEEIVIPHPRLHLRRFVLVPLCEIRAELILPGRNDTIQQLLSAMQDGTRVEPIAAW